MRAIPIVLCLTAVLNGAPQAATLKGRIHDSSGGVIPGATVIVACPNHVQQATSDGDGRFEVRELPPERCSVSAAHAQFASTLIQVDLSGRDEVLARLVMPLQALEEAVVVTPARGGREAAADVVAGTAVVGSRELAMRPYQVLPQALREEPGVSVQQTTAAAGSPIIRGFTGQSNVYLVDGVRLNTAAWRSGPSQYLAWVSPASADRLELVRGPLSVQYGSDALGGAINVLQARPSFSAKGTRVTGRIEGALGSGDGSSGGDAVVGVHAPRAAMAVSAGRKRVGDLRAGRARDSHAAVTRFLGLESGVVAPDLAGTGYEQWSAHLTGQLRVGHTGVLSGWYRRDEQSGVNRYDRIGGGEGFFRSELAPQRLDFAVLRYERASLGWFDGVSATFSINRQTDGSLEQARPDARIDAERTLVSVFGYQAQGTRRFGRTLATFGAELYDESIDAARWQESSGVRILLRPLIPDGTTYASTGAFAQVSSEIGDRMSLRGGVRHSRYVYETDAAPAFGVREEAVTTGAVTFNAAAIVRITSALRATASVGRGFRAANMSDLGSIGLSGGGGFEISPAVAGDLGALIGSTDGPNAVATSRRAGHLGAESVYAYEAGLRYFAPRVSASVTLFDLELYDAIQRRALVFDRSVVGTVISGHEIVRQDAAGRAYVALDQRPIFTRVNAGRARVRGLDADGRAQIAGPWSARAWFSMSDGRDLASRAFLRRMAPPMGGVSIAWQPRARGLRAEATLTFARPQTRLSSGDLSDARIGGRRTASAIAAYFNGAAVDLGLVRGGVLQATGETLAGVQARVLGGASQSFLFTTAPGWAAVGVRALWPVTSQLELSVIGENVTDRNYRLIGSGVDAPGANLQLRARLRF
jgi:outer membrane receptor protein involved in Fe transport